MPKIQKNLSLAEIAKIKWEGARLRKAVGGGLYLLVDEHRRSWVIRTMSDGKRSWKVIGNCEDMSLAEARKAVPAAHEEAPRTGKLPTFKSAAISFVESHYGYWRNEKTARAWLSTLRDYAFDHIGEKRCDVITPSDVLVVINKIPADMRESRRRVRQRIGKVITSAWVMNRPGVAFANPSDAAVIGVMNPSVLGRGTPNHFKAPSVKDVRAEFKAITDRRLSSVAASCAAFAILCSVRSGNAREALWSEIKDGVWHIPSSKMKASPEGHDVPLSNQAKRILLERERMLHGKREGLIFESTYGGVLDSASTLKAVRHGDDAKMTLHGYRATFKSFCAERGLDRSATEIAMAHKVGNSVEMAYLRSSLLKTRTRIMQEWGDYIWSDGGWLTQKENTRQDALKIRAKMIGSE